MYDISNQLVEVRASLPPSPRQVVPASGLFVSNCRHHVSHDKPELWGGLEVRVVDGGEGEEGEVATITYAQALANWLEGRHPFQALDSPTVTNPGCPFDSVS